MKNKFLLSAGLLACFLGLAKAQYSVFPAGATLEKPVENGLFYSLPQNGFRIRITIEETILERGIYSDYAEQLLKLSAIRENTILYRIEDIRIQTTAFPDPEQVFCVQGNDLPALRLTPDGILQSVNMLPSGSKQHGYRPGYDRPEPDPAIPHQHAADTDTRPGFGGIGNFAPVASLNISRKFDTLISKRETDTMTIIEKILQPRIDEKSMAEQARKMADLILKIQADKADLLSGLQEVAYPEGTMEFMYRQMEKNERRYMDCFTGTVRKRKVAYEFHIMPEKGKHTYYLAFFSPESGLERIGNPGDTENFTDRTDLLVLNLELLPFAGTEAVQYETANTTAGKPAGFYYRLPRKVQAEVLYNESVIGSREVWIAQWGEILKLPVRKNFILQLHPQNGSIRYFGPAEPGGLADDSPENGKKTGPKR